MTIEELRRAVKVTDFKPFTISLADGRRFHVSRSEWVWVPPSATCTFHVAGEGEDYSVVDVLLVTTLDYENGTHNGSKGRSKPRK